MVTISLTNTEVLNISFILSKMNPQMASEVLAYGMIKVITKFIKIMRKYDDKRYLRSHIKTIRKSFDIQIRKPLKKVK